MKKRANRILLVLTIVTAALYVLFLLSWLELVPTPLYDPDDPFRFYPLKAYLYLSFHVVPCFCFQLLVCRVAKRVVVRLIPVFLLFGIAALFAVGFFTATGWDTLGWGILLLLCIAPAVGYGLAWAAYGVQRLCQHTDK